MKPILFLLRIEVLCINAGGISLNDSLPIPSLFKGGNLFESPHSYYGGFASSNILSRWELHAPF